MRTDKLIQMLAGSCEPVRPLRRPWVRAIEWLGLSIPYVALVLIVMSPRPDLIEKISDGRFVFEEIAALLTALTAAIVAFATAVPGYDRIIATLPFLPLSLWLASRSQEYLQAWIPSAADASPLRPDWFCVPAIVLAASVPAIAMAVMLRRGVALTPHMTVFLGGLSAAGLGTLGMRLFCPHEAGLIPFVWQIGTVLMLPILAGCAGHYFFVLNPSK